MFVLCLAADGQQRGGVAAKPQLSDGNTFVHTQVSTVPGRAEGGRPTPPPSTAPSPAPTTSMGAAVANLLPCRAETGLMVTVL